MVCTTVTGWRSLELPKDGHSSDQNQGTIVEGVGDSCQGYERGVSQVRGAPITYNNISYYSYSSLEAAPVRVIIGVGFICYWVMGVRQAKDGDLQPPNPREGRRD